MLDHLVPRPRHLRIDDTDLTIPAERLTETVLTGTAPDSEAWALLEDQNPAEVIAHGTDAFVLRIEPDAPAPVVIVAAGETGVFRARALLQQLVDAGEPVPALTVRDWPQLTRRGVVEGFYGAPWSHDERVDFLRFAARVGLNEYIYAPKDDPYHRERWRDPYPEHLLNEIGELVAEAAARQVRFVYTIAPALSMRFSDPAEHALLAAKAEQLWRVGVRSFALLFDDVPGELTDPEDVRVYGSDQHATGRAHGEACVLFRDGFLRPHGITAPLELCPTDYAGCAPSPYRDGLKETLPDDALVMWTGSDIVVGEVTRNDIDQAAESYGRRLLLWDNFPVNDFDRSRLFLGPLQGRTTDLAGSALAGIASNPMVEAAPSRFALASAADWAWNPQDYDPADSSRRALVAVTGQHAHAVTALVAACSAWPPSAPQSPELEALVTAALDGDGDALDGLEAALDVLASVGGAEADDDVALDEPLRRALDPWFRAARDAAKAGLEASRLLRTLQTASAATLETERTAVREALALAESHYPNVLRSVLPRFVLAVLARAGEQTAVPAPSGRVAVLVGANPVPGDRDLSERLAARGFEVTLLHEGEHVADHDVDLIIVTPAASATAARVAAASDRPVLAWGRHDTLGLSTRSSILLAQEDLEVVVGSDHPLAAGVSGTVRVYRGPGKITWFTPGADATVVARTEEGRPAIAHYRAGDRLASGESAPADRIGFFLSSDGLAPWLLAPEGHALFMAAVDVLVGAAEPSLTV
jgi:hypothetical protein